MGRLSLRLRLTLAFATVMAVVLAAVGFFVYVRVGNTLLSSVDTALRGGTAETAGHLKRADLSHDLDFELVDPDSARGETLGQLLDPSGRVVRSSPSGLAPLVSPSTVAKVLAGKHLLETTDLRGRRSDWRLIAIPVTQRGRPLVLVEASSLSSRVDTLDKLVVELALGGAIALLLASLAGYAVTAAALRPVESMRRRASAISAATPGLRLPVPPSRDEISRLAFTLNQMLGRLESSIEHERRFVADASHELRTPLALLKTELELALRRPRSHAELEEALRSAAEETDRLTRLAEDLLLIAHSDQSGLPVRPERLDVDELLRSTAYRFAAHAAEEGREVRVTGSPGRLAVLADPARIEQALWNLVENALHYGAGTVELLAAERGSLVELHVLDDGPGFPPGFAALAFDRFSRADESRGRSGTGLGLAIVDVIARAHGGEAGVSERPAGGADVWIALERAAPIRETPKPETAAIPS
ncbi:MAG TPA: ATP-binding protein [Gaiellaceae bacterium]|jgi:heavy metal sensor kinase|nr:ATP-binding protein [Gaiellaceae bacterium]